MRIKSLAAAIGVVAAAVLAFGGSASAATEVGNTCAAKSAAPGFFLASLTGDPTNPLPNAIPSAGVITSWTIDDALSSLPSGSTVQQKLKVFRKTSAANQLYVVGESALSTLKVGVNTFPTRISVQPGDLIGSTGIASFGSETIPLVIYCDDTEPGDLVAAGMGDPPPGSLGEVTEEVGELAVPVTVQVEPDADGDGFGDETQDQCPTNASIQGPCPAPPAPAAPITLSASAVAGKALATVTLTSSAQASVTVGGSVKLGKGKAAALNGGTQTVTPGSLAKFVVLFPATMKAKLRQLPPSQKVTLNLSANGPGATGTSLTVKVPGQKKATPRHHRRG